MGAGAEIAGHISSKAQGFDEGSQYIIIEDLGPSLACFDFIDATTDGYKNSSFQASTVPSPSPSPSYPLS